MFFLLFFDSELEINIAYGMRMSFYKDFKHKSELTQEKLFYMFDDCMKVMLNLMRDSLRRFARSKEFTKIEHILLQPQ